MKIQLAFESGNLYPQKSAIRMGKIYSEIYGNSLENSSQHMPYSPADVSR